MQQRHGLPLAAAPDLGLDMTAAVARSSLQAMSEFNRELARFISNRIENDAQLQADLARCTCPFEASECVARFWTVAIDDYIHETKAMRALATAASARSMHAMDERVHAEPAPVLD